VSEVTSDFLAIASTPDAARETVPGHWFIAAMVASSGAFNRADLAVWEVSRSSPEGRALVVPGNTAVVPQDVTIGGIEGTTRIAVGVEVGLGTRSVGCE
jgi:hypothetical protein